MPHLIDGYHSKKREILPQADLYSKIANVEICGKIFRKEFLLMRIMVWQNFRANFRHFQVFLGFATHKKSGCFEICDKSAPKHPKTTENIVCHTNVCLRGDTDSEISRCGKKWVKK